MKKNYYSPEFDLVKLDFESMMVQQNVSFGEGHESDFQEDSEL